MQPSAANLMYASLGVGSLADTHTPAKREFEKHKLD